MCPPSPRTSVQDASRHHVEAASPPGATEDSLRAAGRAGGSSLALDQWRGLALVLVLIAHAFHTTGRVDGLGRVGVNLFFFISGILVFRSLAGADGAGAWAHARSFWWRRLRRLYPALLAYVLVMTLAEPWLQHLPGQPEGSDFATFVRYLPAALFCYINYTISLPNVLGHLWSVACEMQFYLLGPLLFILARDKSGRGRMVCEWTLLGLMFFGLLQPLLTIYWDPYKYQFQYAAWPMMLGFWCEYQRDWLDRWPTRWLAALFKGLAGFCLAASPIMFLGPRMKIPTVALGALLLAPCLLAYARNWPFGRSYSGAALAWLGRRTYSIYLWQQAFTICYFLPVPWWPLGSVVSVFVGAVWFQWFEVPFLSSRRRPHPASALPSECVAK